MQPFSSKELVFSLAVDENDPERKRALLRVGGACGATLVVPFASCGRTQLICNIEPASFDVRGVDDLRNLRAALSEMLEKLGPVEEELARREAPSQEEEEEEETPRRAAGGY